MCVAAPTAKASKGSILGSGECRPTAPPPLRTRSEPMSPSLEWLLLLATAAAPNCCDQGMAAQDAAAEIEEIVVTGRRIITRTVSRTPVGATLNEMTLSYRIRYDDLDLHTGAGRSELERRVGDAALAACKEIGRVYPLAEPNDAECARLSRARAMEEVKKAERGD